MRILLDTHTFLWYIGKNPNISLNARKIIEDPSNQSVISIASAWEIAIKVSIGKLTLHDSFEAIIPKQIDDSGFELLNIHPGHTTVIAKLPYHHRDPFDRMLIAQSIVENIPIISDDVMFDAYSVTRLW